MNAILCPACGYQIAVPFYAGGRQPFATLAWPESTSQARGMERHELNFVRCIDCGHVFNASFDYRKVPYSERPNRMFNRGRFWAEAVSAVRDRLAARLPRTPVVVEIGYGDGAFLAALQQTRPAGRYIGFDPHGCQVNDTGLDLRNTLFVPETHIGKIRPDLIISRHVLEHLQNPLGFLQAITFAAAGAGYEPALYLEVPCIDRALETGRTEDFYYEHNSQFTTESFIRMMERCSAVMETIGHCYNGEVLYALAHCKPRPEHSRHAAQARAFLEHARQAGKTIQLQLASLVISGKGVAIWGGTGKSAAFMNAYGVDGERFPIVVDSDAGKAGTFVPGTGQLIRTRDWLVENPAEVIIIPPQWRARDIVEEIHACGIRFETVLIEHGGRLIDYFEGEHPYRGPGSMATPGEFSLIHSGSPAEMNSDGG